MPKTTVLGPVCSPAVYRRAAPANQLGARVRTCEKIVWGPFAVIPAKAGRAKRALIPRRRDIQSFQYVAKGLDPGVRRGDDKKTIFSHVLRAKSLFLS
jgi:hypothetical protein